MDEFENYFVETVKKLDSYGIDYFVHGSTLLGKVRDDCLLHRQDVVHDKELNFGMLAEDFTPRLYYRLKQDNVFFEPRSSLLPNIYVFFGRFDPSQKEDKWGVTAFSMITLYWTGKTKVVEYMGNDIALTWPKKYLIPKSNWETIDLCGVKVKTPYQKEQFLAHYFGKDFMTEKKAWHYSSDSCNRESFSELVKKGELCL